jgi:hypothetical protein
MALHQHDDDNFDTLLRAAKEGNLALLECRDAKTGEYRAVIVAMGWNGEEYVMTPFGHLHQGNAFEDYIPPE